MSDDKAATSYTGVVALHVHASCTTIIHKGPMRDANQDRSAILTLSVTESIEYSLSTFSDADPRACVVWVA